MLQRLARNTFYCWTRLHRLLLLLFCFVFFLSSGLMKWWKMRQARKEIMDIPQWEEDFKLSALPDHHMFWEYLEVGKTQNF